MNSQTLNNKLELIQWLSSIEDKKVIDRLLEFRKRENSDWFENLSKEEKSSISKGLEDAELGNLKSHSSVRSIYEKWL